VQPLEVERDMINLHMPGSVATIRILSEAGERMSVSPS
jgi:hypothetical protein